MAPDSTANRLPSLLAGSQSEDTGRTGRSTVEEYPRREESILGSNFAHIPEGGEELESSFAVRFKTLRRRRAGKQACLSFQIGCTDAALSHWESGTRLPSPRSLARIVVALSQLGATRREIHALECSWASERRGKAMGPIASMETTTLDLDDRTIQTRCLVRSDFSNKPRRRGMI
jgi:DNA-binding transcriptional regulator YiaG